MELRALQVFDRRSPEDLWGMCLDVGEVQVRYLDIFGDESASST